MKTIARTGTAFAAIALLLAACSSDEAPPAAAPAPAPAATKPGPTAPDVSKLPAGVYKLEPYHASLTFKVSHLGFSQYTGNFRTLNADLQIDPANPADATVTATVDLASVAIPTPPEGFLDELLGDQWLGAKAAPQLTFTSTSVTLTGPATADIAGNLTFRGITKPVTLHTTFNGGYEGHPQDPNARLGFSAHGVLKRSDYGITYGIPAPGSTMGVGDEVSFQFEGEFTGPPTPGLPTR